MEPSVTAVASSPRPKSSGNCQATSQPRLLPAAAPALLVIAADHGQPGAGPDIGIGTLNELPPEWSRPMFKSSVTTSR